MKIRIRDKWKIKNITRNTIKTINKDKWRLIQINKGW